MSDKIRVESKDGSPWGTCVKLGDDMIPGIERIEIAIDAKKQSTEIKMYFCYCELDLSMPGCGITDWRRDESR